MQGAVIFDMDGLLIDSEPLWKTAEREVFACVGVTITPELAEITMGLRTDEVTAFWYERQPWAGPSLADVENAVIDRVAQLIEERGEPKDGVERILRFWRERRFPIGLASNSPDRLIAVAMRKLAVGHYFDALCSSVHERQGKPHPAVYLTAAAKLGVPPASCVVFEDSVPGVHAAKAANMSVVAVPAPEHFHDPGFAVATLKLRSLREFDAPHAAALAAR
jgi:sugar-phosphatase